MPYLCVCVCFVSVFMKRTVQIEASSHCVTNIDIVWPGRLWYLSLQFCGDRTSPCEVLFCFACRSLLLPCDTGRSGQITWMTKGWFGVTQEWCAGGLTPHILQLKYTMNWESGKGTLKPTLPVVLLVIRRSLHHICMSNVPQLMYIFCQMSATDRNSF